MLFVMIKNNLKLIFRNKVLVIAFILAPLGVLAILSSAFKELLNTYQIKDTIAVGYSVDEHSPYANYMEAISKASASQTMKFTKYFITNDDKEDIMTENKLHAFITITDSEYELTLSDKYTYENGVIENVVSKIIDQMGKRTFMQDTITEQSYNKLTNVKVTPMPSSMDYYGVIEITYFALCGVVIISMIVRSEKKNKIGRRMQVAGVSRMNMYLSKLIPCSIGVFVEMLVASIISALLLGNHYGNILKSIGILFLLSIASSAFGILGLYIVKGIAGGVIIIFTAAWTMGFYGGTFQNYMMNDVPKAFVEASPLYYVNRTLVEYITMGASDYEVPCVLILSGMIILCSLLSLVFIKKGAVE